MSVIKFKVRAHKNTRHYFRIFIFDTKEEMYAFFHEYYKATGRNEEQRKPDFNAICMPYYVIKCSINGTNTGMDLGMILFYKARLGAGIVAHEMGHAALHYDRIVNGNTNAEYGEGAGDSDNDKEEDMLHVLYHLVRRFTIKCFKLKIF